MKRLMAHCRICERDFAAARIGEDLCSEACRGRASFRARRQRDLIETAGDLALANSAGASKLIREHLEDRVVELKTGITEDEPQWLRWFEKGGPYPYGEPDAPCGDPSSFPNS
jgi:hypothetical protein